MLTKHAQRRAVERYGTKLEVNTHDKITQDIRSGKALFLCHADDSHLKFFAVLLDNKAVPILYDPKLKTVVTIYNRKSLLQLVAKRLRSL